MLFFLGVLFFLIYLFYQFYWKRKDYPPGPLPLPFIGNILQIDSNNFGKQLLNWKKIYGEIYTIWMPTPKIIVSNPECFKELVRLGDAYSGRPQAKLQRMFMGGSYGLVFADEFWRSQKRFALRVLRDFGFVFADEFWRSQKRFALRVLRDFGFGKPILEDTIISQTKEIQQILKNTKSEPFVIRKLITTAVGNVIHQLTFGYTVPLESDYIVNLRDQMIESTEFFFQPMAMLIQLWPGFKALDPLFNYQLKKSWDLNNVLIRMIETEIKKHRETIDWESEPRDYMDAFLMEQKKNGFEKSEHGEWGDRQLIAAVLDLFGAGMETTSATVRMLILYLIRQPEVQKRLHDEIDSKIGRDRAVTMQDQSNLPFLQACITECQRVASIFPMNMSHRLTEDVVLNGYHLRKNMHVVPQFQNIHLDEKYFPNPEHFDPTRHLQNGKFVKNENILPFSAGKRSCLGEGLAKMEIFLMAANLFQQFEFLPEKDGVLPAIKFNKGIMLSPNEFKLRVVPR
uniref:Cytochrome P450 n=1 Tax=Panagrolaimus sp. JU765 TaxID=591449 RepID=A0AC34QME9_9BILA